MYLPERDDVRFLRALVSRISTELVECIERVDKINAAIERYMKKGR